MMFVTMRNALVVALFLSVEVLAVHQGQSSIFGRGLLQSRSSSGSGAQSRGSGSASASAVATSIGAGTVTASAFVSTEAITEVLDANAEAIAEAVARVEGGNDAEAEATATATAIAKASATAFVEAEAEISSTNENGAACAQAEGQAMATATAVAEGLVDALASASNFIKFADTEATVEEIVKATANAYAEARSSVCGTGVFTGEARQTSLATAITQPYVDIFVLAFAAVSKQEVTEIVFVFVDSGTTEMATAVTTSDVNTEGEVVATADGSASASTELSCSSPDFDGCCSRRQRFCRCGRGCFARPVSGPGETPLRYSYRVGRETNECFCL